MAQFANMFEVDLNNRSYPVSLVQTVSEGNVYSNRIGAYVYENGAPVNLGGACTGLVMRADGTTVPLTGYVEGNAAYVVLDQPSCAIPGPIQVAINSVVGENITTLLVAYGTVILTDTRNYVEPGTPLPDIDELLAEIDNMREATAAAEAAATKAVRYDTAQSLTDGQKSLARDNINTIPADAFFSTYIEHETVIGKAYNFASETETAGNYAYIKCSLSSADAHLVISGWNYGSNWPLCTFLDENEHVISHNKGPAIGYNKLFLIDVPNNAKYVIVNGSSDQTTYPSVVYRVDNTSAIDQLFTEGSDIQMLKYYDEPLTSKKVSGRAYNVSTKSETSGGTFCYTRYVLNGEKRIYATGTNFGGQWPGVAFLDENDNAISAVIPYSKYYKGATSFFELMPVDVPGNAYSVIVNGETEYNQTTPYYGAHVYVFSQDYNIKGKIEDGCMALDELKLVKVQYATRDGYAYDAYNNSETAGRFTYSRYTINGESVLYVSGTQFGDQWPIINYLDIDNNLICSQYERSQDYQSCVRTIVPPNARYIIVNGRPSTGGATIYKVDTSVPSAVERLYSCEAAIDSIINTGTVRKYLFVGDSYGAGWSHDELNDGWPTYTVQDMRLNNTQYILTSVGGAGFAGGGYLNQINAISASEPITDVVICGGFNDVYANADTIMAGLQNVVTAIRTKWPTAIIHIGFIGYIKQGSGAGALSDWEEKRAKLVNVVLPCYRNAILYGCRYLSNIEYWLGESGLTPSDGYHPNEAGNRSIALGVANALYTGSAPLPYNQSLRIS